VSQLPQFDHNFLMKLNRNTLAVFGLDNYVLQMLIIILFLLFIKRKTKIEASKLNAFFIFLYFYIYFIIFPSNPYNTLYSRNILKTSIKRREVFWISLENLYCMEISLIWHRKNRMARELMEAEIRDDIIRYCELCSDLK